ncbi:hypothetical protein GMRT_14071 [Giardia muris]|uniref:Signal peptidase complex subunit 2 n=1 Tax=Giardia muris TaxID=5742 RepID=A0A4Z1T7Y9_GIAMU|nr:hypothetical protein GMRT_14071 [Giardia muris]|eukprot:TNJ29277.1 hypothetical protein GMRT_14071 [Giardia muris]
MPVSKPARHSKLVVDRTRINLDNQLEVEQTLVKAITELAYAGGLTQVQSPKLPVLVVGWLTVLIAGLTVALPAIGGLTFDEQRPFLAVGVVLFWSFYYVYRFLDTWDRTILVLRDEEGQKVRVSGRLDVSTAEYVVSFKRQELSRESIGTFYDVDGRLVGLNVERVYGPVCEQLRGILSKKKD